MIAYVIILLIVVMAVGNQAYIGITHLGFFAIVFLVMASIIKIIEIEMKNRRQILYVIQSKPEKPEPIEKKPVSKKETAQKIIDENNKPQ